MSYWLASYPKSGNTWLRALLTSYRHPGVELDINGLDGGSLTLTRELFDEVLGLESSDLSWDEAERYRPQIYERLAQDVGEPLFIKVHDAFTLTRDGRPLFPPQVTAGVVYLVRNPLDVAVSYAHHDDRPIDAVIRDMGSPSHALSAPSRSLHDVLPQKLLTWSGHVQSWLAHSGLRLHLVRYEDLVKRPEATFAAVVRFLGLGHHPERLRLAVERSGFARLAAQEQARGFDERQPTARSFFRRGVSGSWRGVLTPEQLARLRRDHGDTMRRLGYARRSRTRSPRAGPVGQEKSE